MALGTCKWVKIPLFIRITLILQQQNTFWRIKYSDPYRAISFDKLHAYGLGLFGDHIWPEIVTLIKSADQGFSSVDELWDWQKLELLRVTDNLFTKGNVLPKMETSHSLQTSSWYQLQWWLKIWRPLQGFKDALQIPDSVNHWVFHRLYHTSPTMLWQHSQAVKATCSSVSCASTLNWICTIHSGSRVMGQLPRSEGNLLSFPKHWR